MKWKPAFLISGILSFGACGSDSSVAVPDLPSEHGRWAVEEAMRGGQKTNTLDAAFFVFDTSNQIVETNFTGEPLKLGYVYERGVINLRGSAILDSFTINEATDSTLHLTTIIRGTPFFFKLKPDVAEQEPMRESEAGPESEK
jgi:hypothetical protein